MFTRIHQLWRRRRKPALTAASVLTISGLLLAGCGSSAPPEQTDTLTIGLSYRVSSLDPHAGGGYDIQYSRQIFDTLTNFDAAGHPSPGLAEKWEFSPDAKTLTLHLRPGVKFQDGSDFTAEAVKKSLDRARSKASNIASQLATVESIEAQDPTTVVMRFSSPSAHILGALADGAGMIISPESDSDSIAEHPVGAGPYRLAKRTAEEVTLETWDGYWDAANVKTPTLVIRGIVDDAARVRALNSGQINAGNFRPGQIRQIESAGSSYQTGPSDLIYMAGLNTSVPGLDKPEVRQAISQLINRQAIDKNLQAAKCEPITQPYVSDLPGHIDGFDAATGLGYDPTKAKAALTAAGYDEENPLTLDIKSPNVTVYQELAQVIQAEFAKAGINATLSTADSASTRSAYRKGDFEVFVLPNNASTPDPTSWLYGTFLLDGAPWLKNYQNPQALGQLMKVRSEPDPARQDAALQGLVSTLYEAGSPVVPICAPDIVVGLGKGVEGFERPIRGSFMWKTTSVKR